MAASHHFLNEQDRQYHVQCNALHTWCSDECTAAWEAHRGHNVVQGFNRVTAATMLISGQALLEVAGTLAVFLGGLGSHETYLRNMGLVTLASASISACVGITSLGFDNPVAMTPVAANDGGWRC